MPVWHGFWWIVVVGILTPLTGWTAVRLPVVATFSVLGDLLHQVGGEHIEIHTLVGAGGDPHTYEPVPADSLTLRRAALVFDIGLGHVPWLDRLYDAAGSQAPRIEVAAGITPRRADPQEGRNAAATHGDFDPHIWFDPYHTIHIVRRICTALVHRDAAHASDYERSAQEYIARLQALDGWITERVAQLPPARRILVTSHDTFGYFAQRYGFTQAGTALASFTTEAADPALGHIAALVRTIQRSGVPAIFAETMVNPRLMQRIAQEAGVSLAPPLYTDALGVPGSPGATYVQMMQYNVNTIVNALQP